MAKLALFLVKMLCLSQALSWPVSGNPQQDEDEEEGQRFLDLGSAGNKCWPAVSLVQQAPGRGRILQNWVLIPLPGALKVVSSGCSHQLLLWLWVPAGVLSVALIERKDMTPWNSKTSSTLAVFGSCLNSNDQLLGMQGDSNGHCFPFAGQ